jgi:hypothetical protein
MSVVGSDGTIPGSKEYFKQMEELYGKKETCNYVFNNIQSDGYHDQWDTSCGKSIGIASPMEVGFSYAPLPNSDGKYCHYCGKLIEIKGRK